MNCLEFEQWLEQDISRWGDRPAQVRQHLDSCPKCRFSLRLEELMLDAPDWSPHLSMATERRVALLAQAAVRRLFRREIHERLVDAAVTAVMVGGILAGVFFALPGFVHDWKWPQPVARMLEGLFPWIYHLKQTLLQMVPFLQTDGGKALFAAMFVTLLFSLVLVARVMLPASERWREHPS